MIPISSDRFEDQTLHLLLCPCGLQMKRAGPVGFVYLKYLLFADLLLPLLLISDMCLDSTMLHGTTYMEVFDLKEKKKKSCFFCNVHLHIK